MAATDRVLIYVRTSGEWYRYTGRGVTRNRDEAHVFYRHNAERLVGFDADLEIQDAPPKQQSTQLHGKD